MGIYNTADTTDTMSMTQAILIVILVILLIAIHIGQAIFLNLFNKKVNKKNAWISWIPIICLYLLGELTFDSTIAGYALIAIPIIFYLIDNAVIGIMIVVGIYVYAIIKYIALNKEEKEALTPKMTTNESVSNPFEIKKPKLAKFSKTKEEPKKEEKEEPQQYQSEQPMNANSFKENYKGFNNEKGISSSSNSSSLQDLYRK